jgi:adenosylcobinamide-GDP ribazoletransferase
VKTDEACSTGDQYFLSLKPLHETHDKVIAMFGRLMVYMSKLDAIKTFRDLLSFLTIIPLAKTEDFLMTSAERMYLFPVIGALIGVFAAGYYELSRFIASNVFGFVNGIVAIFPQAFMVKVFPAATTLAFLLVLTGLQHFDGLVDLGNAIGLKNVEDRRAIAHAWTVTHKGAFLALTVEFAAFFGLFFLNADFAVRVIIGAEVAAKLAMVTVTWIGKPAHTGLGARFVESVHWKKRHFVAFVLAGLIVYPLLGWVGLGIVLLSLVSGIVMEIIADRVFGGVSGDMIGATNEATRAVILLVLASVFLL